MFCRIVITGVVQGIGFRPFVYNVALKHNLKGYVLNRGDAGVEIQVKGRKNQIESFLKDLKSKKPSLAYYETFEIEYNPPSLDQYQYDTFQIAPSSFTRGSEGSYIPPDLPICEKCILEMRSADPRRKNYPFTSCVDCGPRYTVITSLPYDRPRTTMEEFPLCPECLVEYTNPVDRRFHAQTTCCWKCGPHYYLLDKSGGIVLSKKDFQEEWLDIVKILNENNIIAIKGIGGTHLACRTGIDDPILKLRKWKGARGDKPFAVMSPNLSKVETFAKITPAEAELLQSLSRPIILLEKKKDFSLSPYVSPGLHNVGVLLPYTGIQLMLTENVIDPALVMTSGNPSNIPILIKNKNILNKLASVVDYFLLHEREIYQRADDSVLRLHMSKESKYQLLLRRSRGYVPEPIQLPWSSSKRSVLALGAEMYNVGALGIGTRCFPTQHIGHMTTIENVDFFNTTIEHMKGLMGIKSFDAIGSDLHPQFLTTKRGEQLSSEFDIPFFQFQHHFSHLGALALDAGVNPEENIICVALDGTGYGEDGTIWGGEILFGNYMDYKRLAHLEKQVLLGGDQAISYPHRILLSILLTNNSLDDITAGFQKIPWLSWITERNDYPLVSSQIEKIITNRSIKRIHMTSSCGRLLDTISILLGAAMNRTYEGEPAIKLESFAEKAVNKTDEFDLELKTQSKTNGMIEIQTSPLIQDMWELIQRRVNREKLALSAEKAIARKFAEVAVNLADKHGATKIGMSGGVCYNRVIFTEFYKHIFKYGNSNSSIAHEKIPCGDGGIAIGQVPLILAKIL
ncbi:MAG: carbamoyltransferase HypF [Candidatus Heimdallarchaeota archaeon]|nr:MAG: carbamoyltransferase HypF [Candidatus Heimdallarchaeota archaeon]